MALLSLRYFGDPVLRKKTQEVMEVDSQTLELAENMAETMYHANGIGLAAPQIGISRKIIVVDPSNEEEEQKPLILFNPMVIESEGEETGEEGCLSIPGLYGKVKRPARITIEAMDTEGDDIEIEADGIMARVLQHEIDHLNGVLFIDKLPMAERSLLDPQLKKIQKKSRGISS